MTAEAWVAVLAVACVGLLLIVAVVVSWLRGQNVIDQQEDDYADGDEDLA